MSFISEAKYTPWSKDTNSNNKQTTKEIAKVFKLIGALTSAVIVSDVWMCSDQPARDVVFPNGMFPNDDYYHHHMFEQFQSTRASSASFGAQ